jgi:hypothetical protein
MSPTSLSGREEPDGSPIGAIRDPRFRQGPWRRRLLERGPATVLFVAAGVRMAGVVEPAAALTRLPLAASSVNEVVDLKSVG